VELLCYVAFFRHLFYHDNHIAAKILQPDVIVQVAAVTDYGGRGKVAIFLFK
jgi:hypothetical protein